MLKIIGKTVDGKIVLAEIYKCYASLGIPLEILFQSLLENNAIPSWLNFYSEAKQAGIKHSRILMMLSDPLEDVYGFNFKNVVISLLESTYNNQLGFPSRSNFKKKAYIYLNPISK